MSAISFHSAAGLHHQSDKPNFLKAFINWSAGQEKKRLMWLGVALGLQGCVLLPFAMLASLLANTNPVLLIMSIAAIVMTLITNLAAMPTKITIPVFFLGVLIDIIVIISAFSIGVNFSRLFS